MKTFLWSLILFAGLAGLSACDEDERVDYQYLPDSVHQFVSTYFSDVKVVKAEKKNEEPRYKVWLSNGFELKFYIRNFDVFKHQLAGNFLPFCRFVFYNKVKHFCQGTGMFQKGGADLARYTHHGEGFFHGTIQNNIQNREKTGQKQFLGTHCHAKDRCKIFCKLGTQQGKAHQFIRLVRTQFLNDGCLNPARQILLPQH